MLGGKKFLAGCGIGALATLAGVALVSRARKRAPRSWRGPFGLPGYTPIRTGERTTIHSSGKKPTDRWSILKTGSPISASEYQAPTDREFISNYPKALLPEDLVANVSTARCGPEAHLLPSRRPRATDCIAAIGAIIAVVAVTCFGLDFQKWVQKLSAQLTQSSDTR